MAVERLARRHQITGPRVKWNSAVVEGSVLGERCLLMLPQTYMNRSGGPVQEALAFYKLDAARELLVIVDDVALPCGKIRLRANGSAGGHNGLKDIEQALGGSEYPRLRIGIDGPGRVPQADYVLGRFTPEQAALLEPALDQAADAVEAWISLGIDKAMSRFNG
jgi:PTH1 family peptidyl-tRNA hydrolase